MKQPQQTPPTSNDRFKHLRQLAESTSSSKEVNSTRESEGRFFRAGHVAESKLKVLTDEEIELQKQRARRREEVSVLAKRSAVKNNPLFKKIQEEQQHQRNAGRLPTQQQDKSSEDTNTTKDRQDKSQDENDKKQKRNSKVISSLRNNTYVSSSIFRQAEPDRHIVQRRVQSQLSEEEVKELERQQQHDEPEELERQQKRDEREELERQQHQQQQQQNERKELERQQKQVKREELERQQQQEGKDGREVQKQRKQQQEKQEDQERWQQQRQRQLYKQQQQPNPLSLLEISTQSTPQQQRRSPTMSINDHNPTRTSDLSRVDSRKTMDRRRLSGSQKSQWAVGMTSRASVMHKAERLPTVPSEDSGSDDEQRFDSQDNRSSRKRADAEANLNGNVRSKQEPQQVPSPVTLPGDNLIGERQKTTVATRSSNDSPLASFLHSQPLSMDELLIDSYLSRSSTMSALSSVDTATKHHEEAYGSIAVTATSRYVRRLSQAHDKTTHDLEKPKNGSAFSIDHDDLQFRIKRIPIRVPSDTAPPTSKKWGGPLKTSQSTTLQSFTSSVPLGISQSKFSDKPPENGKLYLRVIAACDVLLPLPKEQTCLRCVISDDKYEYLSRYEILGQHVPFNYECIIDTDPDTIITISLHVRPDLHVRSKMPIARLFSSSRKQHKGAPTLSSYIYQEDGSVGRTRFALAHMIRGCFMRPYSTKFECFNSWSTGGNHKQKRPQDDNHALKVIGNLDIEMLYLPMDDPTMTIPRNLRDCDMAIRIQQWNETFWNTESLTMNVPRITPGAHQHNNKPTRSATLL